MESSERTVIGSVRLHLVRSEDFTHSTELEASWPAPRTTLDVPLLGGFETSSGDGRLCGHSHCFSEDSEAVACLGSQNLSSRATLRR